MKIAELKSEFNKEGELVFSLVKIHNKTAAEMDQYGPYSQNLKNLEKQQEFIKKTTIIGKDVLSLKFKG